MQQINESTTDRIERRVVIRAPQSRVWRALTDPAEFGTWFGVRVEGAFAPGARPRGKMVAGHCGDGDVTWEITIEKMEPEHTFSWLWHPYAVDPKVDYSGEEPTRVVFTLRAVAGGTELTVVESGFDRVPIERRALAYRMHGGGWDHQLEAISKHVAASR